MLLHEIRCFFNHLSLNLIEPSHQLKLLFQALFVRVPLVQWSNYCRKPEEAKDVNRWSSQRFTRWFWGIWVHRPTLGINFGALFPKLHGFLVRLQDRVGVENPFDVTWQLWFWCLENWPSWTSHISWKLMSFNILERRGCFCFGRTWSYEGEDGSAHKKKWSFTQKSWMFPTNECPGVLNSPTLHQVWYP